MASCLVMDFFNYPLQLATWHTPSLTLCRLPSSLPRGVFLHIMKLIHICPVWIASYLTGLAFLIGGQSFKLCVGNGHLVCYWVIPTVLARHVIFNIDLVLLLMATSHSWLRHPTTTDWPGCAVYRNWRNGCVATPNGGHDHVIPDVQVSHIVTS